MRYLERQFRRASMAVRRGVRLEDALAIKCYIHTRLCRTITRHAPPGSRVLEVGCGGSLAIHMLSRLGYDCHALDNDDGSLAFARFLADQLGSTARLHDADAFRLPFENRSFDYVYSVGLVEHFDADGQRRLLAEQARCSRSFVHVEVPNYARTSAFYPVYVTETEPHLPCDPRQLLEQGSFEVLEVDGRCVFTRQRLIEANPVLHAFVRGLPGFRPTRRVRSTDIERLCALEDGLTADQRLRHGYQHYAVGRWKPHDGGL